MRIADLPEMGLAAGGLVLGAIFWFLGLLFLFEGRGASSGLAAIGASIVAAALVTSTVAVLIATLIVDSTRKDEYEKTVDSNCVRDGGFRGDQAMHDSPREARRLMSLRRVGGRQ